MSKNNRGGQAPFGFRWVSGELTHEPNEAAIYAEAFELYLVRQRFGTVAKILNERGYRTRQEKPFKDASLKHFLQNPIAKGTHRVSTTHHDDNGEQIHTVHENAVPPIVSETVWNHVQDIIKERAGTQARNPKQDLFVGIVSCDCGPPMELASKSKNYRCHKCDQIISKDDVHKAFEHILETLPLPNDQTLSDIAETHILTPSNTPTKLLKKLDQEIDSLFTLYSKKAITEAVFQERHAPLEKRKEALLETIRDRESPNAKKRAALPQRFASLPDDLKRNVIENLIASITVSNGTITISIFPLFNVAQHVNKTRPSPG